MVLFLPSAVLLYAYPCSFSDSVRRRCSVLQWNPDVATQLIVASDEDSSPSLKVINTYVLSTDYCHKYYFSKAARFVFVGNCLCTFFRCGICGM